MVGFRVMLTGVGGFVLLCGPVHRVVLGFPGLAPSLFSVFFPVSIWRFTGFVWFCPVIPVIAIP